MCIKDASGRLMCYTDTASGRKDVVRGMSYGLWDMMCSGNIEIKEENIMHELGIVFHIAKKVESLAVENHVNHVAKVVLQIGEVSTVIPEYLDDCWKWKCTKSEILKDCELEVEMIPAVTFCEDCEKTYGTVEHGKICPYCGSEHTYLVQGNEHAIKEIVVYDEDCDENADAEAESEALEEIENEDHGAMPIGDETEEPKEEA